MSGIARFFQRILFGASTSKVPALFKESTETLSRSSTPARDLTKFALGDRLLLDGTKLLPPLARNLKLDVPGSWIDSEELLGRKATACYIRSQKGHLHTVQLPSLDQYVSLTPRRVTPIYASYASTIVSLLDINPVPWRSAEEGPDQISPRINILEAGTGHGSLTLHLARAIAASNPPQPVRLPAPNDAIKADESSKALLQQWQRWKSQQRRAIVHTIDVDLKNRIHAEKVVRGFRQGQYWAHVDFHHGNVRDWLKTRTEPHLMDYVLLDMPGVHRQLQQVHSVMKDDAKLLVFVPSITQIGDCVRMIAEHDLPLTMIDTVELGEGISTGRKWDVRLVKPRKSDAAPVELGEDAVSQAQATEDVDTDRLGNSLADEEAALQQNDLLEAQSSPSEEPVMICRPRVGERLVGGGFVAIFRKQSAQFLTSRLEWQKRQSRKASKKRRR
jgi:tRNA A58 N-methylase Trm61